MAAQGNAPSGDTSDREIVTSRVFDAPRELVFRAFTEPEHVVHWWGPNGFTNTNYEMDVRPGGVWRFMMHGPDGVDYPNKIVYEEVVAPERLVYVHDGDDDSDEDPFHVTITFDDENGKTKVIMRAAFGTAEERARVVKFGAIEGGKQTLERLVAYLTKMS